MRRIQIIIICIITCATFSFKDADTCIILDIKKGKQTIDSSKIKVTLLVKNKPQLTLQLDNNLTCIKEFADSARVKIMYGDVDIETPLLSYSQFTAIERLEITILNKKQIKKKYEPNTKWNIRDWAWKMQEWPRDHHSIGFLIEGVSSHGATYY